MVIPALIAAGTIPCTDGAATTVVDGEVVTTAVDGMAVAAMATEETTVAVLHTDHVIML